MTAAGLLLAARIEAAWLQSQMPAYRACDLCTHGRTVDGLRHCTLDEAVQPRVSEPVGRVRSPHGACGPEARLMSFPGLAA